MNLFNYWIYNHSLICIIMIENIVILLLVNTFLPFIPIEPTLLLPAPLVFFQYQEPSAFQIMNLTRLYKQDEFKKVFRQSLRVHHPDLGGSQELFQQIQGLKNIMKEKVNYYDLYNVTNIDISADSKLQLKQIVQIKTLNFYVQLGMFYFITILYILAFTLEQETKYMRKIMLLLAITFLAYQYYIHQYPSTPTVIDYIYDKIPLFEQRNLIKRFLIIILAILRTRALRKRSEEKIITESLKKQHPLSQSIDLFSRLLSIYREKSMQKQQYNKSIWAKIRSYVSKGISILFFFLMIRNFIGM